MKPLVKGFPSGLAPNVTAATPEPQEICIPTLQGQSCVTLPVPPFVPVQPPQNTLELPQQPLGFECMDTEGNPSTATSLLNELLDNLAESPSGPPFCLPGYSFSDPLRVTLSPCGARVSSCGCEADVGFNPNDVLWDSASLAQQLDPRWSNYVEWMPPCDQSIEVLVNPPPVVTPPPVKTYPNPCPCLVNKVNV